MTKHNQINFDLIEKVLSEVADEPPVTTKPEPPSIVARRHRRDYLLSSYASQMATVVNRAFDAGFTLAEITTLVQLQLISLLEIRDADRFAAMCHACHGSGRDQNPENPPGRCPVCGGLGGVSANT